MLEIYNRRNRALSIILNLSTLYLNSRLNDNKYCEARIRRRLSLSILILLSVIYLEIDIVVK